MTEKEIFDKVIDGLNSQQWEDTNHQYRYVVDNEDGYSDRRSPLGWAMTEDEEYNYRGFAVSRILATIPRLQEFRPLLFELEQAWNAKKWRDGYSGFMVGYSESLKQHRRAAIYDVGRSRGLLGEVKL